MMGEGGLSLLSRTITIEAKTRRKEKETDGISCHLRSALPARILPVALSFGVVFCGCLLSSQIADANQVGLRRLIYTEDPETTRLPSDTRHNSRAGGCSCGSAAATSLALDATTGRRGREDK